MQLQAHSSITGREKHTDRKTGQAEPNDETHSESTVHSQYHGDTEIQLLGSLKLESKGKEYRILSAQVQRSTVQIKLTIDNSCTAGQYDSLVVNSGLETWARGGGRCSSR